MIGDTLFKRCARCREGKTAEHFHKAAKGSRGLHAYCKLCSRERAREWRKANSEKAREAWRKEAARFRTRRPDRARELQRMALYGVSNEVYEEMLKSQDGVCGICKKPPGKRNLAVDHDHLVGNVRGLLCDRCNGGLGMFRDSPDLLMAAVAYLGVSVNS